MVSITWSNGHRDEAASWDALLDLVRDTQWRTYSELGFRYEMQKRAYRWSGLTIDVDGSAQDLFVELQRAKLIVIDGKKQ